MNKISLAISLLCFVAMQSLAAQTAVEESTQAPSAEAAETVAKPATAQEDTQAAQMAQGAIQENTQAEQAEQESGTFTLKLTPSAEARGVLNFAGDEQIKGNTVATDGDAEGRFKVEADYNGILGAVVELEGDFNKATENSASIGFGDNAYIYAHALEIFGLIDKKILDLYIKAGRFEVGFQNAQYAGDDDWLKDLDPIGRDNRINMQLDLKLLDMLTLRSGVSFAPFDDKRYGDDWGISLLFEKVLSNDGKHGEHKIIASFGYTINFTNNIAKFEGPQGTPDVPGNNVIEASGAIRDYDQMALSLAYQGTFGQIVLMPFFNMRTSGLFNKPKRLAYKDSQMSWNAGIQFRYKDAEKNYDIVGLGLDFDGIFNRDTNDFYDSAISFKALGNLIDNSKAKIIPHKDMSFQGFQIKVWSDALRHIMGENYLKAWLKARFETWVPEDYAFAVDSGSGDVLRKSIFKKFAIGFEQYFVNKSNGSVSLFAEFAIENIAPFTKDTPSHLEAVGDYGDDFNKASSELDVSLQLGLKASFMQSISHGGQ